MAGRATADDHARRIAEVDRLMNEARDQAERVAQAAELRPAQPMPPDGRQALIEDLLDRERQARIDADAMLARERREAEQRDLRLKQERVAAERLATEKERALVRLRRRKLARISVLIMALVALVAWILRPPAPPGNYRIRSVRYDHQRQLFVINMRPDPDGTPCPSGIRLFYAVDSKATRPAVDRFETEGSKVHVYVIVATNHEVLADEYLCHVEPSQTE